MIRKIFILAVVCAGLYYCLFGLKVRQYKCRSQLGECKSELTDKLDKLKGKTIIQASDFSRKILVSDFTLEEYRIRVVLPDKINIDVIEKVPKYAISNSTKSWAALIDDQGTVIELKEATDLPVLVLNKDGPKIGERVSDEIKFALDLMSDIYYVYQVQTGTINGDNMIVDLDPNIKLILPLQGDRKLIIGSIILLDRKIRGMSGSDLTNSGLTIDLRYKNPVIRL